MRYLAPRRGGSPWTCCARADWPLTVNPAPVATPASAAVCFRNRLRLDRLESMILPPVLPNFQFEVALPECRSRTNVEVFDKIVSVSTRSAGDYEKREHLYTHAAADQRP